MTDQIAAPTQNCPPKCYEPLEDMSIILAVLNAARILQLFREKPILDDPATAAIDIHQLIWPDRITGFNLRQS